MMRCEKCGCAIAEGWAVEYEGANYHQHCLMVDKEALAKQVAAHAVAMNWQWEDVDARFQRDEITLDEAKAELRKLIREFIHGFARLVARELIRAALEKVVEDLRP